MQNIGPHFLTNDLQNNCRQNFDPPPYTQIHLTFNSNVFLVQKQSATE